MPLHQPFRRQQCRHRDQNGYACQPQCRAVAARCLCQAVDRRRQRLSFTWDIRDERNRRAEFADGLGKGKHRASAQAR